MLANLLEDDHRSCFINSANSIVLPSVSPNRLAPASTSPVSANQLDAWSNAERTTLTSCASLTPSKHDIIARSNLFNPCSASPSLCSARNVSSASTFVVPSQIGSTWLSRNNTGNPVSSTYPAPPKLSSTSLVTSTACLAVVSFMIGVNTRNSSASSSEISRVSLRPVSSAT